jgi:hypothetical protein
VVKPGDKISVTKGKMFVGRFGLAQAQEFTIKLTHPLGLPKKRPIRPKPAATNPPRQRPQNADPEKEPVKEAP